MKFLVDTLFIISFLTFCVTASFIIVFLVHGLFGCAWASALIAAYTGPVSYILNKIEVIEEE